MTEPPVTQALTPSQQELVDHAKRAREHAYARYSQFKVGAAVRGESGNLHSGCNVENASFGLSICAERVAIFKAVCAGERKIVELALVTDGERASRPCGACRQVLSEFGKDAIVIMSNLDGSDVLI